jgi:PPOX class probable F420-dependent enzyme
MTDRLRVPDSHRSLLDAPVAVLSTNGANGLPQVTAVGFLHDPEDDLIKISLNDARQKTKNLHRDPRATLFILDPQSLYRTLEIRAEVELIPDSDLAFASRAGKKYNADFTEMDRPGETRSIVVLHPVKINVADMTPAGQRG